MDAESRGLQSGWVEATAEVIREVTKEDTRVKVPAGTRSPRLSSTPATWQAKTDGTEIDIDEVEEEVGDISQSKASENSVTTTTEATREAQITTTPTFTTITSTATKTSKRQPELTEVNFSD